MKDEASSATSGSLRCWLEVSWRINRSMEAQEAKNNVYIHKTDVGQNDIVRPSWKRWGGRGDGRAGKLTAHRQNSHGMMMAMNTTMALTIAPVNLVGVLSTFVTLCIVSSICFLLGQMLVLAYPF